MFAWSLSGHTAETIAVASSSGPQLARLLRGGGSVLDAVVLVLGAVVAVLVLVASGPRLAHDLALVRLHDLALVAAVRARRFPGSAGRLRRRCTGRQCAALSGFERWLLRALRLTCGEVYDASLRRFL